MSTLTNTSDGGVVFICIDCGATVWQAIATTSSRPRCYICNWLQQNPNCPPYMAERLRNGRRLKEKGDPS